MFREAWGSQCSKKQSEFNKFLESNRMCISMELVTAVLGDHGQRPREDYVVVTAVTDLGCGKPKFYSTPDVIAFCRKWRLPTNHVWLFSTRKSVISFFAAYDALCEEGTAKTVCKALDEVADVSIPGSKDHIKVQGEILEGLVARIVSRESSEHMEQVLRDYPLPPSEGDYLGSSLRDIWAENRSDEKQQIKALLESVDTSFLPNYMDWFGNDVADGHSRNADRSVVSKFLQALPADFCTTKLQEMVRLMTEKRFPAAFKCYHNFHKINSVSSDSLHFRMVIHVHSDSAFRRYQEEMRPNPGLWPLYRGFFVDVNLFKNNKGIAAESSQEINYGSDTNAKDGLANEDANLMIKLKFLKYKIRTFLIRNGLPVLFKRGEAAYKAYYLRQMKIWNTSAAKQRELSRMLDDWAVYIRETYGHEQLSSFSYLNEAEPFLEQYAKRSPKTQALIGSAGSLMRDLAIIEGSRGEERDIIPSSPTPMVKEVIRKDEGLIVFFPGIPGCAKSALCKEIMSAPGVLGDDRPVHHLMGDLFQGKYWGMVAEERCKEPYSVILADKNAPNRGVWRQIEDMCRRTKASAIPVVPDSEGTESNPFSLDALAVFMFRVLHRANHPVIINLATPIFCYSPPPPPPPALFSIMFFLCIFKRNLDKSSPHAGYVLLKFYDLYHGKNRNEFEAELIERFGLLVKMPLLEPNRAPLPECVRSTLQKGLDLYGRLKPTQDTYSEWPEWETRLRETLLQNVEYMNSIQVTFESSVESVLKQLKAIAKGEHTTPSAEKRSFGTIAYAAVNLPVSAFLDLLDNLGGQDPKVEGFLKDKDLRSSLTKAHLTLAHKRSHGVTAVANYGPYVNQNVPISMHALLFSEKSAALEAEPGVVDGEKLTSKNEWPHVTLWTAEGVSAKEANVLPRLLAQGKATRVEINPPITITGVLEFF
ncbi:hypothetical protein ABFX02_14G194800 [Erythranthe guttata]